MTKSETHENSITLYRVKRDSESFICGANNYEAVVVDNKDDDIWKIALFIIIAVIVR